MACSGYRISCIRERPWLDRTFTVGTPGRLSTRLVSMHASQIGSYSLCGSVTGRDRMVVADTSPIYGTGKCGTHHRDVHRQDQVSFYCTSFTKSHLKMAAASINEQAVHPKADERPIIPSSPPPARERATGSSADAALELIAGAGLHGLAMDPETNRRLVRKVDWHIMPLICTIYFLQYIDKTAISYASVTGL
jgi:hypothetical protein